MATYMKFDAHTLYHCKVITGIYSGSVLETLPGGSQADILHIGTIPFISRSLVTFAADCAKGFVLEKKYT